MPDVYALILAGGSGERFWPVSRRLRPKQLLSLFSDRTLIEETVTRLEGLVPRERILVLTNADQEKAVRALLADLPAENIVAEPAKRDTAAAIALATGWVAARDPKAVMMVLPADHLIRDRAGFHRTLQCATALAAERNSLITIGIPPAWPCPAFGYIECGERLASTTENVHGVVRFREKPNADLAAQFLEQGNFRWNAGIFVWAIPTIRRAFEQHVPALASFVEEIAAAKDFAAVLNDKFAALPKISIDYAVMEKAGDVLMVEAAFDWDDVGSWAAVEKYWERDAAGNSLKAPLTSIAAGNNIVFSDTGQRIALLAVRDLIIVQTSDALLVAHRSEAENIKKLVAELPPELQ
jgi:mannose-1-phosphate guanylyltransferase